MLLVSASPNMIAAWWCSLVMKCTAGDALPTVAAPAACMQLGGNLRPAALQDWAAKECPAPQTNSRHPPLAICSGQRQLRFAKACWAPALCLPWYDGGSPASCSASISIPSQYVQGHCFVSANLQLAGSVETYVVPMQSFFYLWRVTGKQFYRDWNWQIFQAFENYSRTEVAHAAIQVRTTCGGVN